jgi:dTDP-4-amino-4,6-dideoxy-D-galactose acyltransferase
MSMAIEPLEWDSSLFGWPVGRLMVHAPLDNAVSTGQLRERLLEASQYRLVYVLAKGHWGDSLDQYCDGLPAPALCSDRKLVFAKAIDPAGPSEPPAWPIIRYQQPHVPDSLLQLALASGEYSRFRLDPMLQEFYEPMYRMWIEKSVSGQLADDVLVRVEQQEIVAFVTVSKIDGACGQIGLIAVSPSHRGRGLGTSLLIAADRWYEERKLMRATVKTQLANTPARRLYEKAGYRVEAITTIYHYWNPCWAG